MITVWLRGVGARLPCCGSPLACAAAVGVAPALVGSAAPVPGVPRACGGVPAQAARSVLPADTPEVSDWPATLVGTTGVPLELMNDLRPSPAQPAASARARARLSPAAHRERLQRRRLTAAPSHLMRSVLLRSGRLGPGPAPAHERAAAQLQP